jgi:hypothetical protein
VRSETIIDSPSLRRPADRSQTNPSAVPLRDVLQSPDRFDKQTVQLRGNINLAFEDFSLTSEACPSKWPADRIWLRFGGDAATPTMSTVNDTVQPPGVTRTFGGIAISLVKDDNLERFFLLSRPDPGATLSIM